MNQEGGGLVSLYFLNQSFVATVFCVAPVAYDPLRNVNMAEESVTFITSSEEISLAAGWNMCKQTRHPTGLDLEPCCH